MRSLHPPNKEDQQDEENRERLTGGALYPRHRRLGVTICVAMPALANGPYRPGKLTKRDKMGISAICDLLSENS